MARSSVVFLIVSSCSPPFFHRIMSETHFIFFDLHRRKKKKMVSLLHSSIDPLCCQETWVDPIDGDLDDDVDAGAGAGDLHFEEDLGVFFSFLASREAEGRRSASGSPASTLGEPYLGTGARKEAIGWVLRAAARHGFSPATAVLAADYLDRCFVPGGGLQLRGDSPWMARLSAVGCLSLAAKVEETRVPLLLDLQLAAAAGAEDEEGPAGPDGGGCYMFEPRTVRRMELLVLSTLQWRMSPVTPFSFLLPLLASGKPELLRSCEAILLSAVADGRWVEFPPSVWAAAALINAGAGGEEADHLMALTNAHKESVGDCCVVVRELLATSGNNNKRKKRHRHGCCSGTPPSFCCSGILCSFDDDEDDDSRPPSPNGVIVPPCFSRESSSSSPSGARAWPSISSSPVVDHVPHPSPKKPKGAASGNKKPAN